MILRRPARIMPELLSVVEVEALVVGVSVVDGVVLVVEVVVVVVDGGFTSVGTHTCWRARRR